MAVYKQTYRGYDGPCSLSAFQRVAVIHRYARKRVFSSRFLTILFIICLLVPLFQLVAVYLANNFSFLTQFADLRKVVNVNNDFFATYLGIECGLAFIFIAFATPGLVAPDVTNGGLSLYLARPLSRWEYMLGKFSVLFITLSWLTWIPALIVFTVQMSLAGAAWRSQYGWLAISIVIACWIWIAVISALALAISAWVKWRILAVGALLAVDFLGAGFGAAINATLQTKAGDLVSLNQLFAVTWTGLFRQTPMTSALVASAWIVLAAIAGISLWLIQLKVRGLAVVR
ncbi:MAG: hypothetical protein ACRD0Y_13200 [Terriglobales bacterium]